MPHRHAARFLRRWWGTAVATLVPVAAVAAVAVIQHQANAEVRASQVAACQRGNVIRLQMAEDNAIAIQAARTQLAGGPDAHLSPAELEALRSSIARRQARAAALAPYPCDRLK